VPRSIRFPTPIWKQLAARAKAEGLSLHSALRVAILGPLRERVVFVGGATVGLLLTDAGAPEVRRTAEVDAVVGVSTLGEWAETSAAVRARGFREDTSERASLCRFRWGGLLLDGMPAADDLLGFGNRWYPRVMATDWVAKLPDGTSVRVVSSARFLATKR
jgi:hypothetical protein